MNAQRDDPLLGMSSLRLTHAPTGNGDLATTFQGRLLVARSRFIGQIQRAGQSNENGALHAGNSPFMARQVRALLEGAHPIPSGR